MRRTAAGLLLLVTLAAACSDSSAPPESAEPDLETMTTTTGSTAVPPASPSASTPTTTARPAEPLSPVEGRAFLRFADTDAGLEVCLAYVHPTTGADKEICGEHGPFEQVLREHRELEGFDIVGYEFEYFRADSAAELIKLDPEVLPLHLGDTGVDVSYAQAGLRAFCDLFFSATHLGSPEDEFPEPEPGTFDAFTEQMLRTFQRDHGLIADGVYGAASHEALVTEIMENTPSNEGCWS